MHFNITPVDQSLKTALTHKINLKTKPVGSLGKLEDTALRIGLIQNTLSPKLQNPAILVCAGDHGITAEGVSPYPQEVTFQMLMNYLQGGAAINVFARQNNIKLLIADTGVNYDFDPELALIHKKIAHGTRNFAKEPAMSTDQCEEAIQTGANLIWELHLSGTNIVGFGEMGIGNTSAASALLCSYTGCSAIDATGAGTGWDEKGIQRKATIIQKAVDFHGTIHDPLQKLATFGGFEIAAITGAMLKAAELKMTIMVDGFIITSALLAASEINKNVLDYCIFSHKSHEKGHGLMLDYLNAKPILDIQMRLGEGTGSAVAYPIIQSSVNFLNEMSSFEEAGVSEKS